MKVAKKKKAPGKKGRGRSLTGAPRKLKSRRKSLREIIRSG